MVGIISLLVFSCSTEKNSAINRTYHGLTAHYNGYFNANELIRQSMMTYNAGRVDDYYSLLIIDPLPNQDEVIGMYPSLDTAIAKCKKVIRNHSMPSNDRPALKKEEHNKWIDENWTTIGVASFYRRDYEGALKSFEFVKKFYSNDPSLFVGELWMAKTYIAQGKLTKAKFHLDNLDAAIAAEGSKEEKSSKSKRTKKGDKEDEPAKFPKKIRFDFEKTKADLAISKGETEKAIEYLEESLKHAGFNDDKSRVHFVLGQLYQEKGNTIDASKHYTKVIKGKAPYNMNFNARLKRAFLGDGPKVKKELNKMLRDAKNAEFKDQIYYAMADIEFKQANEVKGIEYLTLSAFYSTKNTRQKGMAYERLGDISFGKKNYVSAQKYYDSCAIAIDDTYPNAEGIRNKARNLSDLVVAVETSQYEDSVQRIAAMSESDREVFLKDLIKKIKEEEELRKKREAERLRELQENENLFVQEGDGSKWYWNNAKTRAQGFEEFKKLWGSRENEDDWRRSEKIPQINFEDVEDPNQPNDSLVKPDADTLTVENLLRWIPLTDSMMALSNTRLLKSYYDAGIIYKDQLNEAKLAEGQFNSVLDRKIEDQHNLLSAYQLYKMKLGSGNELVHKNYILDNYPNSDFANYIRDPEYFVKKKERDALAEQEYVTVLDRYDRGLYYPVLTRANQVIAEEKDNLFRAKYMLLQAMCTGQLNENKQDMLPVLETLVVEYPESQEAVRAKEMIGIIKNGYSDNIEVGPGKKSDFTYEDDVVLMVLVFLEPNVTSNSAKTKISDFHREFFSRDNLKVSSKIFGTDQSVILVNEFEDESKASEYIRVYKKTRKHLLDLQNAKILMITQENMKTLFQKGNLAEYEVFYEEYY